MEQKPLPSPEATPAPKVNDGAKSKSSFWLKALKYFGLVVIALVIIVILVLAYLGAKTGFVKIPGISAAFYQTPKPDHLVSAEELNSQKVKERVQSEINQGKDPVEVYITEGNLTSMLNSDGFAGKKLVNSQAAIIGASKLEIFGKLDDSNVYITAIYDIGKDAGGHLKISDLVEFRIGQMKVPKRLINSRFFSEEDIRNLTDVSAIENALSNDGTALKISDIKIEEGKIVESVSLPSYNGIENSASDSSSQNDLKK